MRKTLNLRFSKIIFISLSILIVSSTFGQERLSVPIEYLRPKAFEDRASQENFAYGVYKSPRRGDKEDWYVISDRDVNFTYERKNTNSTKVRKLKFKQICYVAENNTGWLRLMTEDDEDIGWIQKDKVLQWRRGLLDAKSGINLKGFILNKIKDFNFQKLESAEIYSGPESSEVIGSLPLHDFYFVYKIHYSEEGVAQRYLLASVSQLSRGRIEYLKGWVDVTKITEWNTRLCLEPNFTEKGFDERKNSEKYHIKGFDTYTQAAKVTSGNYAKIYDKRVLWDNDPVVSNNGVAVGTSNSRRLKGDEIRFPILESNNEYYTSGVLAAIPTITDQPKDGEVTMSFDPEVREELKQKLDNLNIVFCIEGSSPQMSKYLRVLKNNCNDLISKSNYKNVNISVGIYKDTNESDIEDYFKFLESTSDINEINNFLDRVVWGQNGDFEPLTCWHYGLYRSLKKSKLSKNATNIVVQLGNYADFSVDPLRKIESNQKYLVDKNVLRKLFSDYSLHWIIAKVDNDDTIPSDLFNDNIREYINDFTKEIYTEFYNQVQNTITEELESDFKIDMPSPLVPKLSEGNLISTKNFFTKNYFLRPNIENSLSAAELNSFIDSSLDSIYNLNQNSLDELTGNSITISDGMVWTDVMLSRVRTGINRVANRKLSQAEMDDVMHKSIGDNKFFNKAYFSRKQPNQRYPPFSIVLFMPESDLINYQSELANLSNALDEAGDSARDGLHSYLQNLARKFSAGRISSGDASDMSIVDIMNLMVGIGKEGYSIEKNMQLGEYKLKDIKNTKKFPDRALENFGNSILESTRKLERIIKGNEVFEYKYKTDENNTYYWIPVELMY